MADQQDQKEIFKDQETQEMLNKPVGSDLSVEDWQFLEMVLKMVKEGKIGLHQPSSLVNTGVYNGLSDEDKGKIDLEAVNVLSAIREVVDLENLGHRDSAQMQYTVQRLRLNKERIESISGDVFII